MEMMEELILVLKQVILVIDLLSKHVLLIIEILSLIQLFKVLVKNKTNYQNHRYLMQV
jgi:hypothetical protein